MSIPSIVFSNSDLIVLRKPHGIPVDGAFDLTLKSWLENQIQRQSMKVKWGPYPLHYIDRAVEGLVLFACKKSVFTQLQQQMQKGDFKKVYLAKCEGDFSNAQLPFILKNHHSRTPDGKKAIISLDAKKESKYCAIKILESSPYVKIELITGRFHQIRAQLAFLGKPIVGDLLYSKNSLNVKSPESIQLCAAELSFFDPKTGERLLFTTQPSF
jgi:23S rRNA pseudouridine1911/1915/1917 synthase